MMTHDSGDGEVFHILKISLQPPLFLTQIISILMKELRKPKCVYYLYDL